MTRPKVKINGVEVREILKPGTISYLFVKKDNGDDKEYYYLGRISPILDSVRQTETINDAGNVLPIVNILFHVREKIPDKLYEYLTK